MSAPSRGKFGISPTVVKLGIVSLLTDVSSESIYPLIPLFLKSVLRAQVVDIGLIEGLAESTASVLRIFSGWLSDKTGGRKWITVAGYSLSTVSKPLLYLSTSWQQVLGIRFSDRLGKGIRSAPRDALIADVTSPESRGIAFGFHRAMDTVGAITGPLIAYILLRTFVGSVGTQGIPEALYRRIFLFSAIPAALGVLILIIFVTEKRHANANGKPPSLGLHGFSPGFKKFLAVTVLFSIGNSSDAFLILRAQNVGISTLNILLVYVLFNTVEAAFDTLAGAVSDRIGRKNVILAGYVVFAVVYAGFGFAGHPSAIWVLFGVYGLYSAMTQGVQRAFAADLTSSNERGTGMGAYQMLSGLALLPASLVAGYLWSHIGPAAAFYYGAATALCAAILLGVFFPISTTCTDK
jgi:MFS family permease